MSGSAGSAGAAAWADALAALALFAADPAGLGGVALRAGPGAVRDRWLALLRAALPDDAPLRRLPAQTGDDRLLGGLDLAATLQAGRPVAQQGLLAEAHGGVVLLAMAERAEPGVTGRLCAALDQGAVPVMRDGLSLHLPARFGLVALDEGIATEEATPAPLLDRLAFHVDLTAVALRDATGEPDRRGPHATRPLEMPDDAPAILCATAAALGIASLRAPLLALAAARAAARLDGGDIVQQADLALAARLVLAPRATRLPQAADSPDEPPPESPLPQSASLESPSPESPPGDENPSEEAALQDRPLADVVLEAASAALPPDLLARLSALAGGRIRSQAAGRAGQFQRAMRRGRPIGTRQGELRSGARLHVLETLKAAAPWQSLRRDAALPAPRIAVRRADFRIVRFRQRAGTTTVFAVDASGSAALNRLGEAKGAVELLLADCYVRRDQVALIAFRDRHASLLLPPTGSLLRAKRGLAGLPGGGATPLAAGIEAAAALADAVCRRGRTPVIALLTDGRANIALDGAGGRARGEADALDSARRLRAAGIATLLVDTAPRPNPFACRLAEAMGARYLPLPYADASALSHAVRSAAAACPQPA